MGCKNDCGFSPGEIVFHVFSFAIFFVASSSNSVEIIHSNHKCGDSMTAFEFTIVVWALSAVAGFLGALTGLGGGVVVVPALTIALGVDMKYAIGASLVSVIATSSGAAAAYVKEGFSNIRIGMFLEIATTVGAVVGALLAGRIGTHALAIIFGL